MEIKEITIGRSFKMSKNYNACEASVYMTASLDAGDDEADSYDELSDLVDQNLKLDINKQINEMAKLVEERKFK